MNEAFFANCVILTEGPTDEIACKCALGKLDVELDRESISVLGLGGKGDLHVVAGVLQGFHIPTIVLIDEDPGDETTEREINQCRAIVGDDNVILQRPNLESMFGRQQKPNRADALEFFPTWFGEHQQDEVPDIYSEVAARAIVLLAENRAM